MNRQRKEADMHIHSNHSDGDCSIAELVSRIKKAGLKAAVLTDHDKVSGVQKFRELCAEEGILTTTGIEISTDLELSKNGSVELHILGYGFDLDKITPYWAYLNKNLVHRLHQINDIINKYDEKNEMHTSQENIVKAFKMPGNQLNNKYWVAKFRALNLRLRSNFTMDFKVAFEKSMQEIKQGGQFYAPRKDYISPEDAIEIINKSGGYAVWAHPLKEVADLRELEKITKILKEFGLHGIETHRGGMSESERMLLKDTCAHHELNHNFGGSDYHGDEPDEQMPGKYLGMGGIDFSKFALNAKFWGWQ